jgi:hypothetical protein
METGRQSAPTRSLLAVPPMPLPATAPAATSGASPAGVGGAATERYPPAAHGQHPADVRSCAPRPALRSVRDVGCASCPPSDVCLRARTIGLRRRPLPQAATLDRQLRPPYLRRWLRHGSTMQRPRGRVLLRGMSLAQTPPRAPPSKAVAGRVRLSGAAGGDLPCKVRDAERRAPASEACLVHVWATCHRNPAVASGTSFAQVIHAILRDQTGCRTLISGSWPAATPDG